MKSSTFALTVSSLIAFAVADQAVSQITDGQIQASTATTVTSSTVEAVSQITDGQIQATTATTLSSTTLEAVSQITDGQVQATTSTFATLNSTNAAAQLVGPVAAAGFAAVALLL